MVGPAPKLRLEEEGAKAEDVGREDWAYGFSGVAAWWGRRPSSSLRLVTDCYSEGVSQSPVAIHARILVVIDAYRFLSLFAQTFELSPVVGQFGAEVLDSLERFLLLLRDQLLFR